MPPLNPDCTPGWTEPDPDGGHIARCGCGWSKAGLRSKTKAKAAQRDHRFPPLPDDGSTESILNAQLAFASALEDREEPHP